MNFFKNQNKKLAKQILKSENSRNDQITKEKQPKCPKTQTVPKNPTCSTNSFRKRDQEQLVSERRAQYIGELEKQPIAKMQRM